MSPISLAIIIGVVLMNLVVISAYILVGRRRTVGEQRLAQSTQSGQIIAAAPDKAERRSSAVSQVLNRALVGRGFGERIQRDLARADLKLNVAEYLALHIILGFGFALVGYILGGIFLAVVFGIGAFFVPRIYVGYAQNKRLRDFDNQLGDMLNLTVNGLRAGYSSMQAQESVARELPPPISVEFHRVVQE